MQTTQPPASRNNRIAVGLLLVFAVSAAWSSTLDAVTFDETAHLPAGLSYLQRGDFRLNAEHPPLAKAWAALPLWLSRTRAADYSSSAWTGTPRAPGGPRTAASQWIFGYETLNGPLDSPQRRDPRRLLVPARLAMIVPGLALGWIVFAWARQLWGAEAGLLALFLYAISPTMLAHTRLVTTDLPSALGLVGTLWSFWRFTRAPGWWRAGQLAAFLALALGTKFSSLILGPMLAVIGLVWVAKAAGRRDELSRRAGWLLAAGTICIVFGIVGIWAIYGFRFRAAVDPGYLPDWEIVGLRTGRVAELIRLALERHLLPEGWLYGLAYFLGGAGRRVAFLNGETSLIGWWYYFPEAFLLKTPPGTLLLTVLSVWTAARRRAVDRSALLFLVLPALIYVSVSIQANLNIGHRHLTPVYPLLFILLGSLWPLTERKRWARSLLVLLMAGNVVSFVAASPRYLSYFNLIAGGPSGGWRYLLDSNIDWGQDLPRVRDWMRRNDVDTIDLAYFGTADPAAYGISFRKLLLVQDFHPETPSVPLRSGRVAAISVNLLQGLYVDDEESLARRLMRRGEVGPAVIREWLELRDRSSAEGERHPPLAEWLVDRGHVPSGRIEQVQARLLGSRLAALRDQVEPAGRAGDSILIYRVP